MSKDNKYRIAEGDCISVPKSVLNNLKFSNRKSVAVLLHFLNDGQEELDIDRLAKEADCDKETVEEAMSFWTYTGILIKNEDTDELIKNKLEMMLKRTPLPYETKKVAEVIKETEINFQVALKILDIGIAEEKRSSDWAVNVIKDCAKSKDQEEKCDEYRRYFSLTKILMQEFNLSRELTSKERTIIFEWAKNKIPLEYIYNVYLRSKHYTQKASFQYMNSIISKADPSSLFDDGNLGY